MVVILEGIDGAGKSTVFEELKLRFGETATYIKESYPGKDPEERVRRLLLLESCIASKNLVIYDRSTCIDDLVYEPVIAGQASIFDSDWIGRLSSVLKKCLIIQFVVSSNLAAGRIKVRGDDYVTPEKLHDLHNQYQAVYHKLGLYPVQINVDCLTPSDVAEFCEVSIEEWLNIYQVKTFKLAHIVPLNYLHLTASNAYHMCLAHLILQNDNYADFYKRRGDQGCYVLMDNGAAENSQLELDQLLACYHKVHPTELVLRDELCNQSETYKKTVESIEYFKAHGVNCKFMAVPQGQTFEEWCISAEQLILLHDVHTLGVSKFLTVVTKDPYVRYKAVAFIDHLRHKYNRYVEVHLLGCDAGAWEPIAIRKEYSFVRGCDTALAEIFTKADMLMRTNIKRPPTEINFIEEPISADHQKLLDLNIDRFDKICGVVNVKTSEAAWES